MAKKILIIILVLMLLGAGAWFFFSRSQAPASTPQTLTNVLPFGNGIGSVPAQGQGTSGSQGTASSSTPSGSPAAHLFKLSDAPVAGAVAFMNKAGSLDVRYVDRATGHIYDIDPTSLAKKEIVNTTLPKIYNAVWKPDGSAVIFQTLGADGETIQSSSLNLIPPAGTSTSDLYTTTSTSLPADLGDISVGVKDVFYNIKGLPQIILAIFDGSKAATIFSSPFTDWQIKSAGDSAALLVAKPSAGAPGYAYILSSKGTLTKLLGPMDGLTAVSNSALSRVVYSFTTSSGTVLASEKVGGGTTNNVIPATLADKCVWSAKSASVLYCGVPSSGLRAGEPDLWYQGISHYSDRIWRFDVDTDYADVAVDPKKDFNIDIDAEKLFLSPSEDYLFFINKNDLSLWALKLD